MLEEMSNVHPEGTCNWDKNNTWAQQIIIHNVTSLQMNHVRLKSSAEEIFSVLIITHENKVHQTVNHFQCLLYETKLHDVNNLLKHLDTLKSYHHHINRFLNTKFHVSDTHFKVIISVSLPYHGIPMLNLIMETPIIPMILIQNSAYPPTHLLVCYRRNIRYD